MTEKTSGASVPVASLAPVVYLSEILKSQGKSQPRLSCEQSREIGLRIDGITNREVYSSQWIYNHLRVVFQVERWEDIPASSYPAILSLLDAKKEVANQYRAFRCEMNQFFHREILGGNTPWTPALKTRLTRLLHQKVKLPKQVDWLTLADDLRKMEDAASKGEIGGPDGKPR
jgi:hypothetical protein